ncbi:hypothetical protein [Romboutsia sp.]|uniref:hypothetical protein n=1 Tax=Romboutsia sp. TaxID=1965302 RepID=UPI002CD1A12C|nr:hypothetical protein [Romboutsia sp.]HSQ88692.1 hypothetical protein [Romboutsia sp.]
MNLAQALDFLASNCPNVFAPISQELETLRQENDELKANIQATQEAVDFLIMGGM